MKNYDFLTQVLLFLASIGSISYSVFSESDVEKIKRGALIAKFLGGTIVAFFVMPAIQEYFELSLKVTLLLTVIIAYGYEALLKASVSKITKIIENGKDDANL